MKQLILSLALILGVTMPAMAQVNDPLRDQAEFRLGATEHDISILGLGESKGKENSGAINAEIVFPQSEFLTRLTPGFLRDTFRPQPWVGGTLNLGGRTSYGGAGALYRWYGGERLYGEWATGVVVHNGELENERSVLLQGLLDGTITGPFTEEQTLQTLIDLQDFDFRQSNNIEFGGRVLFRNAFTAGYRVNRKLAVEVFIEHLSHGNIIATGSNEGLESWGLRTALRF
jgi:lipid A 3-O-deacylase